MRKGDPLIQYEVEKLVMDHPSCVSGTVEKMYVTAGQTITEGAPLAAVWRGKKR